VTVSEPGTTVPRAREPETSADAERPRRGRIGSVEILVALLILLVIFRAPIAAAVDDPAVQTWTTVFVAIMVQAVPFLVGGVVIAAAIAVFVPRSFWQKALPRHPALAVPMASCAGAIMPGCECGAVPIAGSLVRRGVSQAAALAFLLAAPAINPIVLVSTAVAFPNNPELVLARGLASLAVAVLMGWLWLRLGRHDLLRLPQRLDLDDASRARAFWSAVRHDVVIAGGFLVIGAAAAATINVVVPEAWIQAVADQPWLAVLVLAALAVLLSICSEADAFVAASLNQFSLTARLVFLVVGPVVDLKLVAMQAGMFGRRFAATFAPLTLLVAVGMALLMGWWLL
jgi:uncharacterized protein